MKKTICCVLLISPLLFVNDSSASLVVSNIERVVSAEINYSYYTTMSNTIGIFNEFKSMNYPGSEWDEPYNINAYQNSNISATTDALSLSAYGYISADGDHYGGWTPSSTVYLFFSTDNSYSYSY
ncbi:MAG: hypothetical protein KJ717_10495, partial [Proteobacteria bacterium]|nr:hypothetical protein [Pseudomonadota bacterium]